MIILKYHEDRRTGLVALCDVCGCEIEGAEANILWTRKSGTNPVSYQTFIIACKVPCTEIVDEKLGHQYSQDFDTGMVYLINNTKTNLKKATRSAEVLSQLQ